MVQYEVTVFVQHEFLSGFLVWIYWSSMFLSTCMSDSNVQVKYNLDLLNVGILQIVSYEKKQKTGDTSSYAIPLIMWSFIFPLNVDFFIKRQHYTMS